MASIPKQQPQAEVISETEAVREQFAAIRALGKHKAWPFLTGNPLVAFNSGLVGLVSNSFFRRMLRVRKGLFLSSLPMAALPAITVTLIYPNFISSPILMGDLDCPLCASLRGGSLGFTLGAVYPFLLAIPLNASLAMKYETIEIPFIGGKQYNFNDVVKFWQSKMKYFKGQFISIAIFQTLIFAFVADRQFQLANTQLETKYVRESR